MHTLQTLQTYIHYITKHNITLHYIALHYTTLHYIAYIHSIHTIKSHYITLHGIALHTYIIYIYKVYAELKSCKLSTQCTTLLLSPFVHLRQSARNSCTAASSTLAAQLRLADNKLSDRQAKPALQFGCRHAVFHMFSRSRVLSCKG